MGEGNFKELPFMSKKGRDKMSSGDFFSDMNAWDERSVVKLAKEIHVLTN